MRVELGEDAHGGFVLQLPQGVAAYQPDGEKRQHAGYAGGNIGGDSSPASPERENGSGEKQPARDLDQITQGKEQDKNQLAVEAVFCNPMLLDAKLR